MCQGNSSATEEISYLFTLDGRNCSRVKSNAMSYFTVSPSRCIQAVGFTVQEVVISVLAPHLMETSP